ncbi:hypothetical protein ZWY2020_043571 [Hordeum vulgare]|nr:hypothetical protein ZWY2020_043571 [Hordeum vulgare]
MLQTGKSSPSFFLRVSPARVARDLLRSHPGRAPPTPNCFFAATQDALLRSQTRPIACSRRQGRARPSTKTCAKSACSTASQDVLLRYPGPGLPPGSAADILSRHPEFVLRPPRTCTRLGLKHLDREFPPRPDLELTQARPGPQARAPSDAPLQVVVGPLLVLLLVRSAGLLACLLCNFKHN